MLFQLHTRCHQAEYLSVARFQIYHTLRSFEGFLNRELSQDIYEK